MVLYIFITVMAGTHEARCDVQTDLKITPEVIKIGNIRTFNAKVGFPKGYDLRPWTIMSITCGDILALPDSIKKGKRYVKASFNTQDLIYLADGEKDLAVTILAEKDGQTITFAGSGTVRFQSYAEPAASCESLASLNMNNSEFHQPLVISGAELVPAGPTMPEYCKVSAAVGNDGFELRLPTRTWSGKILHQGGGGNCGVITTSHADDQLQRGYATVGTNAGHDADLTGSDARWGYDAENPDAYEREIDYGYRAVHVTTIAAKLITEHFFNKRPEYAYFRGCSTGGRQGLMEAQRYPDDFDGIIAGDPPIGFTGISVIYHGWPGWINRDGKGRKVITDAKAALIKDAVYDECDGLDGVEDGVISDPRVCTWDPSCILCQDDVDTPDCLTVAQVNVVRKLYDAPRDLGGNVIYPGGRPRGTEVDWPRLFGPEGPAGSGCRTCDMAETNLQYIMSRPDPGPTYSLFDFPCTADGCDRPAVEKLSSYAPLYNATTVHLEEFKHSRGKMIMYVGWATAMSHPYALVDYYERVSREVPHTNDFFRLYVVPGMGHCRGGPADVDFKMMFPQLENWVERGIAPEEVAAIKTSEPKRARLLCPYPRIAKYKGENFDSDMAESYTCINPDYPVPTNEWDSVGLFPWDAPPTDRH